MAGEAICLVIDVGASASQQPEDGASFLNAAQECASLLVERKLFGEIKDEIAVILFGTEETSNDLGYDNIKVLDKGLCRADWDTITYLRKHIKGTGVEGDWINAIIVALDFLKTNTQDKKYTARKIVLFSDLGCAGNNDEMDLIVNGMKGLDNFDFTYIGPDWAPKQEDDSANNGDIKTEVDDEEPKPSTSRGEPAKPRYNPNAKPRTSVQKDNEEVVQLIAHDTEGTICSLDEAVAVFLFKAKKGKKPWPWKVVLEIGPDIRISTTGYVMVRREPPKTWRRCLASNSSVAGAGPEVAEIRPETMYIRNNERREVIEPEDMVTSYRYGNELVTITDEDEAASRFEGGPKSLKLFGFINRGEIEMHQLIGNGSMAFFQTEGDANSEVALSTLAQAMLELNVVAIVRRVYNSACAPRLGVLAPEDDGEGGRYLAYVDLPFAEDRRELQFAPLEDPSRPVSEAQLAAVDQLIDTLNLEVEEEDAERLSSLVTPEETLNPLYQYLFQALTERAINPEREVPSVPTELLAGMDIPREIQDQRDVGAAVQRIRELFPLEEVEDKRKGKRTGDKVFGDRDNEEDEPSEKKNKVDDDQPQVHHVGTINPVEDFIYLLANMVSSGSSIQSLGIQMEAVIDKLLASAFGTDLNSKIVGCIKAYREACIEHKKPEMYNEFIRVLKGKVGERLWKDIVESESGLIKDCESFGGAEEEDAVRFLRPRGEEGTRAEDGADEEEEDMMDLL